MAGQHSEIDHTGLPGVGGGGGGAPAASGMAITDDVTMTNAETWYDSGLTLTLAAGDWLILGKVHIQIANSGTTAVLARITNSDASTVYDASIRHVPGNAGQEIPLPLGPLLVSLGETTTIKVQCQDAARASSVILGDSSADAMPDNQVSRIAALAVTIPS